MTYYSEHLKGMPERDQFKSSTGKNILSILAGAMTGAASGDPSKGLAQIKAIKDDPYNEALNDWSNKGKSLKTEADIERENLAAQKGLIGAKSNLLKDQADQELKNKEFGLQQGAQQFHQGTEFPSTQAHQKAEEGIQSRIAGAHEMTAQAAMAGVPGKQAEQLQKESDRQQKQYEAEMKPVREAERNYSTMAGLSKEGNSYADLGLVHTYIRDLTNSARAAGANGVQAYNKAVDWETKFNNTMARTVGGRALSPESIKNLVDAGQAVHDSYFKGRKAEVQNKFAGAANKLGLKPEEIMSDYGSAAQPNAIHPHAGKSAEQLYQESR
jgi:hypothetical protein